MSYSYIFGPVSSRRLGCSLGIDLVPFKTCNLNCIYCECGESTTITDRRKEYIPTNKLINELGSYLDTTPSLDYVTIAGGGEPTLNSSLGTIIEFIKKRYPQYKTALLTNGTLFHLNEIRNEVRNFDCILPSLDAVSESAFKRINRPSQDTDIKKIIEGLITFSNEYQGQLWIEIFIVPGINDSPEELSLLKKVLNRIKPTRIQLNSLDRPGSCNWVPTATTELLHSIAKHLKPLPIEIISRKAVTIFSNIQLSESLATTIENQLLRRPATIEEIAVMTNTTINEAAIQVNHLLSRNRVITSLINDRTYYSILKSP